MGGVAPSGCTLNGQLYFYTLAQSSGGLGKSDSLLKTSGFTFDDAVSEINNTDLSEVEILVMLELV
ncbi:MAG: hypothetical protein RBT65_12810 [Methanolobus sp.]|nr:hypothetical protein [Methanolobus sp.]